MAEIQTLIGLGSLVWAAAFAALGWLLVSMATAPRILDVEKGRFEEARRRDVRKVNATYRICEPWVDELCAGISPGKRLQLIQRDLNGAGVSAPWLPAELVAVWRIEAFAAAAGAFAFGIAFFGFTTALTLGVGLGLGFYWFRRRQLGEAARKRVVHIKRRLAYAIDLIALMLEVGGNFQESLQTVANEVKNTPLGDELARLLREIEAGRPRKDALTGFGARLGDDDAAEIVFAIVKGEELGTPLAEILRGQAEQLRLKRSQWAERASQEAQVTLVFPAMVIMIACLVIVVAPFILSYIFVDQSF